MNVTAKKDDHKKIGMPALGVVLPVVVGLAVIGLLGWKILRLEQHLQTQSDIIRELSGQSSTDFSVSWAGKKWCSYGDSITGYNDYYNIIIDLS